MAVGTTTVTSENIPGTNVKKYTVTWVASADTAAIPNGTLSAATGHVLQATTNPGATAPTDNYDIVINDSDGIDVFGGNLANRDTANSEQAAPSIADRFVNGDLTVVFTNNSVNSANGVLCVYVAEKR